MKALVAGLALLALAPAARAGTDAACGVKVSSQRGAAPLRVTFHATCASKHYRWRFGDGAGATGRTVSHRFLGGRFTPMLSTDRGRTTVPAVTSVSLRVVAPT